MSRRLHILYAAIMTEAQHFVGSSVVQSCIGLYPCPHENCRTRPREHAALYAGQSGWRQFLEDACIYAWHRAAWVVGALRESHVRAARSALRALTPSAFTLLACATHPTLFRKMATRVIFELASWEQLIHWLPAVLVRSSRSVRILIAHADAARYAWMQSVAMLVLPSKSLTICAPAPLAYRIGTRLVLGFVDRQ